MSKTVNSSLTNDLLEDEDLDDH